MANINTFRFSQQSGFLLLDSLMSIVLISIAMLVAGHYTFAIIESNHDASLTLRALNVATQLLDQCIYTKTVPVHTKQNLDPFTIDWQVQQQAFPVLSPIPPIDPKKAPFFNIISLAISFKSFKGTVRSLVLSGGFLSAQEKA